MVAMGMLYGAPAGGQSFVAPGTDLASGIKALSGYYDVLAVLRSQHFITENSDGTGVFRRGTMLRLNGPDHTRRRRTINHLVRQDHHKWFRETSLYPTLQANLAAALSVRDEQGLAHVDLIEFVPRTSVQLAAAMIGLDASALSVRLDELMELVKVFRQVPGVRWVTDPGRRAEIMRDAMRAKADFDTAFFQPALAVHMGLFARIKSGHMRVDELPLDFLTLVAAHSDFTLVEAIGARIDPSYMDHEVVLGEAVTALINGAIDTTTFTVTWCVQELTNWFQKWPADNDFRTDPIFLRGAVNESIRLHPVFPAMTREATEDLQLPNGMRVAAGELVALQFGIASRDRSVYGEDADEFNPRRVIPRGVLPYGLAFGSGSHMCYGMPIVLGDDGSDGSLVHMLVVFNEAGMRPDPARGPALVAGTHVERFSTYPVVFEAPSRTGS